MGESDRVDKFGSDNEGTVGNSAEGISGGENIAGAPEVFEEEAAEVTVNDGLSATDESAAEDNCSQEAVFDGAAVNIHETQVVGNENPYNGIPYTEHIYIGQNNGPYNASPYGNNAHGGQPMQNGTPYNANPYGNNAYGGQPAQNGTPYNANPYGGNAYGGQPMQNGIPYGNQAGQFNYSGYAPNADPNGRNPYSPYAALPRKNNTGLIIGIVIAIIVLFIIAVAALAYKAVSLYSEERGQKRSVREEHDFDDDFFGNYDDDDWHGQYNDEYADDWYGPYGDEYGHSDWFGQYGDGYDGGYNYDYDNDKYYTLHDDIRTDLTYSVDFEYYEYDTDYANVDIQVSYPVIKGEKVPNLEKLNSTIQNEIGMFTEYFEEEYQEYFTDDDFFSALSSGYVTYMDEEKMSIVFSEYVYSNYYNDVYLYCINIDMENGVILNNENILSIDDDFSVEFRQKSDIQNDEIASLTMMSDQEITKYFNSEDVIVFYTPKGMEIGFNYEDGWVTVTYEDYEKYLKVF